MDELLSILHREGFEVIGYADDLTVICRGKFLSTLCERTQRALNLIERWCKKVGLAVNQKKSEVTVFTNKRKLLHYKAPTLFGAEIPLKDSVKFLGVIFTPNLN